jgi:tetratricopeptide (TPR) repeat protein
MAPIFLPEGVTTLAKGRISAQELKRDPLMDQYMNAAAWAKGRSRPIMTWLTIAAVVIAVALIAYLLLSRRSANAAESLARAMAYHDAIVANPLPATLGPGMIAFTTEDEKHKKAFEELERAAREYPSQHGDMARYLAATHQLHFEPEKAEATLKELAQKGGDVGAQARLALAGRYEATGKNEEAAAEYQKLKSNPGPIPPALIDANLARVYEATGKTQEAIDLYFGIASNKDLRSTSLGNTSVTRLSVLAPEKVDQLPPPETTNPMASLGGMGGGMPIQVR